MGEEKRRGIDWKHTHGGEETAISCAWHARLSEGGVDRWSSAA